MRGCRASVLTTAVLTAVLSFSAAQADVRLPALFTDHMVLQQGHANPVWGLAAAGEKVSVTIAGQTQETTAGDNGQWRVTLPVLSVGGPHQLVVTGKNTITVQDVLVGEVWVCSGQSNMQWSVNQSNDPDLETRTANFPHIRLISVPQVGTQETQADFQGSWSVCSPESAGDFSGVGYFFGRQLHQTLNVPIGLIDNAWGGSSCEAWVCRSVLQADAKYQPLLDRWAATEQRFEELAAKTDLSDEEKKTLTGLKQQMNGQHRPGNLYCGVLNPTIGYGIRGAIWYQGESNAGRAYQYRDLFPLMIQNWRDEWRQGDFPFYWVQLADFRAETPEPKDSDWAELREAQTMTLSRLPNTGEAVIVDLGEAEDIHPRNKQDVAKRLARWALAKDYGVDICYHSPRYRSSERQGNKLVVKFEIGAHPQGALDTFDTRQPVGFAIAGADRKFVWANAKIVDKETMEVWSDAIPEPAAVRYAWADNPVCNLQNVAGLPATPFRTDDWPGLTAEAK